MGWPAPTLAGRSTRNATPQGESVMPTATVFFAGSPAILLALTLFSLAHIPRRARKSRSSRPMPIHLRPDRHQHGGGRTSSSDPALNAPEVSRSAWTEPGSSRSTRGPAAFWRSTRRTARFSACCMPVETGSRQHEIISANWQTSYIITDDEDGGIPQFDPTAHRGSFTTEYGGLINPTSAAFEPEGGTLIAGGTGSVLVNADWGAGSWEEFAPRGRGGPLDRNCGVRPKRQPERQPVRLRRQQPQRPAVPLAERRVVEVLFVAQEASE